MAHLGDDDAHADSEARRVRLHSSHMSRCDCTAIDLANEPATLRSVCQSRGNGRMSEAIAVAEPAIVLSHSRGLVVLFFAEMWECFSF